MNILFVNEKCGYYGGVEQHVAAAATGLRQRGHRCELAYAARTSHDPDAYDALFDAVHECRGIEAEDRGEPLEDLVAQRHIDVLYVHKVRHLPDGACRVPGVHAVRMVHDHDLCCPRRHKYDLWRGHTCQRPMGWHCIADGGFVERGGNGTPEALHLVSLRDKRRELEANRRIETLVVASRYMRDELLTNGFDITQIRVLPPVLPATASPAPRPPERDDVLLFVGQLVRGKGVDLLLRALERVGAPFHAVVVGDGNGRAALEAQSRALGLERRVRFVGWLEHERLTRLYDAASLVVVPSRWPEPFGLVGLEAMARARPVVAFDVGAIGEWLKDGITGRLVPEQDWRALAAAIAELLEHPNEAARLGQNGLDRARRHYSFDHYLDKLERVLARPD